MDVNLLSVSTKDTLEESCIFWTSDLFNIVWLSKQIGKDAWSQIDTVDLVLVVTTDYNGLPTSPHRISTIRGATENIPINGNKRQSCWWYPVSKIGKSSRRKHLKIYILTLALFHLVQDTPLWQKLCFLGKVLHYRVFLLSRFPPAALSSNIACFWTAWESAYFLSQRGVSTDLQDTAWESAHF